MTDLRQRTRLSIDGTWHEATRHEPVVAPWSGEVLAEMAVGSPDDVDRAVAVGRTLIGRLGTPAERAAVLDDAAAAVRQGREGLARLVALESAKPIRSARSEVDRAVETLRFSAAAARTLHGETIPMEAHPAGDGLLGFTLREPIGVVAAITPFNFPLNLVAHKLGPAVAAGCPVVLKPAEKTPLSALALVRLLVEAGLDTRAVQVVTGLGPEVGVHLASHTGVDVVSFTGSATVGHALASANPRARVLLELGSAAPLVVERDADVEAVTSRVAAHAFAHAGQSCVSVQRLLLHADVADRVLADLLPRVASLRLGDPLDESSDLSCLIRPEAAERVAAWVAEAERAGATLLAGGGHEGASVRPTVLSEVPTETRLWQEEVFGPVVVCRTFSDTREALDAIAAGPDLIQAGIFTRDIDRAMTYVHAIDAGSVLVNESPTFRVDHMPYGGVGTAGNTREGPASTVRELTREKLVVLRTDGAR